MNCDCWFFRVDPHEIAFLRFVLEACDGMALLTTLDAASGKVCVSVAPGREGEARQVLAGLERMLFLEQI